MFRFSRAIFVEIKDLVDPHPETVSVPEAKRRVLQSCEATIERLARDPHYFAKPSQSLFQGTAPVLDLEPGARVQLDRPQHPPRRQLHPRGDRAQRRGRRLLQGDHPQGQAVPRTPLPEREYCPSHQHLEERKPVAA